MRLRVKSQAVDVPDSVAEKLLHQNPDQIWREELRVHVDVDDVWQANLVFPLEYELEDDDG